MPERRNQVLIDNHFVPAPRLRLVYLYRDKIFQPAGKILAYGVFDRLNKGAGVQFPQ